MEPPEDMHRPPDHEERMEVARAVSTWQLGDPAWAGMIIRAYLYPRSTAEALEREKNA